MHSCTKFSSRETDARFVAVLTYDLVNNISSVVCFRDFGFRNEPSHSFGEFVGGFMDLALTKFRRY